MPIFKKVILCGILIIIACFSADSSYAYVFTDPINNAWPGYGNYENYDRIGSRHFELFSVKINPGATHTTFDIYTNFYDGSPWQCYGAKPADLALDLDGNGIYEYGIAFTNHDNVTAGTLYDVSTWNESDDYFAGYIYHHDQIVRIANGSAIGANSLAWYSNDPTGILNNDVADWRISLALDNSYLPDDWYSSFNFFYGGATCANDYIGGSVTPEPATMSLLGLGLLGINFLRRRKANLIK